MNEQSIPSQNVEAESTGLDIGALFSLVVKHWLQVVFVAGCVVGVVVYWVTHQTPIYRAEMSIKIEPHSIRPLGQDIDTVSDTNLSYWSNLEYSKTQLQLLQSRTLAERVVQTLQLHKSPQFLAGLPEDAPPPADAKQGSIEGAAKIIQRHLDVAPVQNSRIVELGYEDADPKRAQRILRTVADTYIERNLESQVSSIGSAAEWLNNQLARLKQDLEESELALHDYKKENHLLSVSLDERSNMLDNEMSQLNGALVNAKTARQKLAARVEQLNRIKADDPSELPAGELLESTALQLLRTSFVERRSTLERARSSGRGENHPEVRQAEAAFETTRESLLAEVRNIQESLRRDLAAIDKEIAGLNGLFQAAKAEAFELNLQEIEFRRLARARENAERLHSLVLERSKESELTQQMKFNNVSTVDVPLLPRTPVKPRVPFTIAFGAVAGFALGIFLVLLRARLDNKLREPHDVEEVLGVTCLAAVPTIDGDTGSGFAPQPLGMGARHRRKASSKGRVPELCAHFAPRSTAAEAVRTLRTNLAFMSPDKPHRCILITSAGPTDGKTTVASSLAITMAQSGHRVLLLDSDLRRPRLGTVFGLDAREQGLTKALLHPSELMDNVKTTEVDKLSLLPSGPVPPNPAELLHSENFKKVLAQAAQHFDRIVIDSPPLMPVTDAAILSRLVDTTVLVVRSGDTQKDHAKKALRALRDVKASVAGVVLNGHKGGSADGYYYRQYYGHTPETQEAGA